LINNNNNNLPTTRVAYFSKWSQLHDGSHAAVIWLSSKLKC